jgi:hypothetical protein
MPIPVLIVGSNGREAVVGEDGTLVVTAQDDEIEFNELAVANQAYNFYEPRAGKRFILTGVVATADKDVVADATVVVYEASSSTETTVDKTLFQFVLLKNQQLVMPGFHITVAHGAWVNGKTDDDDIHMSLIGHFVDR